MFIGASTQITGTSHAADGRPCQDRASWRANSDGSMGTLVLCDGAGSCEHSEIGAGLICDWFPQWIESQVDWWSLAKEDISGFVLTAVREQLAAEAKAREIPVRVLSSTFLAVTSRIEGDEIAYRILHLGDGVAACIAGDGTVNLSDPDNGEFANETVFTTSKGAASAMRVIEGRAQRGSGFILMSDGSAASLFLKAKHSLAPAVADMIAWLNGNDSDTVSAALEANGKELFTAKSDDDCSIAILLDRDSSRPFDVKLKHPQPMKIIDE